MGKRKHHGDHEEHIDESWLIPYADLLTLLLALFIVLFAASNIDIEKYNSIMSGLYEAIHGNPPIMPVNVMGLESAADSLDGGLGDFDDSSPDEGATDDAQTKQIVATIQGYIRDNNLGDVMSLGEQSDGILLTLKSDVWFASGSAQITAPMLSTARSLSRLIETVDKQMTDEFNARNVEVNGERAVPRDHLLDVIVTGHTDNLPINNAQFRNNMQLSLARAYNFLIIFYDNPNLDPRHLSARGYGEYKPVASNDTPEGRQTNRRVEVYIPKPPSVAVLPDELPDYSQNGGAAEESASPSPTESAIETAAPPESSTGEQTIDFPVSTAPTAPPAPVSTLPNELTISPAA